jgi:hypothetical protein
LHKLDLHKAIFNLFTNEMVFHVYVLSLFLGCFIYGKVIHSTFSTCTVVAFLIGIPINSEAEQWISLFSQFRSRQHIQPVCFTKEHKAGP